jgi:hypothetical protein
MAMAQCSEKIVASGQDREGKPFEEIFQCVLQEAHDGQHEVTVQTHEGMQVTFHTVKWSCVAVRRNLPG